MKTLASLIFAFALGLSMASANEGDKKADSNFSPSACTETKTTGSFQGNLYQNAQGRISLILLKEDAEPFSVRILDEKNMVIYTQKIKEDSIRQNFFLKDLDPGEYRFTVTKNGECFAKTITVK